MYYDINIMMQCVKAKHIEGYIVSVAAVHETAAQFVLSMSGFKVTREFVPSIESSITLAGTVYYGAGNPIASVLLHMARVLIFPLERCFGATSENAAFVLIWLAICIHLTMVV
jgi:hypothetical protein